MLSLQRLKDSVYKYKNNLVQEFYFTNQEIVELGKKKFPILGERTKQ